MQDNKSRRGFIVSLLLTLLGGLGHPALACSLGAEAYDLDAFLRKKSADKVVFVGAVVTTAQLPPTDYATVVQNITFKPSQWWLGEPAASVTARGRIEKPTDAGCSGVFDFVAQEGQLWLVAGISRMG